MDTEIPKRPLSKRLNAEKLGALPAGTYGDPAQECLEIRVRRKANGYSRTWPGHGHEQRISDET